ncbi:MAG: AMP-binding protein, partial [Candidatus Aminicenantes bacterium]
MLYDLLLHTAAAHPDKLAVICGEKRYDYRQFKDRVDRLASGLRSLNIQKNERIAVIHKNCHRYLEIYFASAKIGAILVPINYRLSVEDFIFILDNSQARLLITQPDLVPPLLEGKDVLPHLERIIYTNTGTDSAAESFVDPSKLQGSDERNLDYESLVKRAFAAESGGTTID